MSHSGEKKGILKEKDIRTYHKKMAGIDFFSKMFKNDPTVSVTG